MHQSVKALAIIAATIHLGFGQSYVLDTNFNARISGTLADTLAVHTVAIQPDGKLVIGGAFTKVGEVERNGLARLHPDGSVDETFDPGTGVDNEVNALLVQPDGKVLAGGRFTLMNGLSMSGLARVNADGSFDYTWGAFLNSVSSVLIVHDLMFDADGEITIGGFFTHVAGATRVFLAKVSTNSVVSEWNPVPNNGVLSMHMDGQNRLIIGGGFTRVSAIPQAAVSRILPDGGLDPAFNVGSGPDDGLVFGTADGGAGRVLIGGAFTNVNGSLQRGLARLQESGALDTTFKPQFNGQLVLVFKIVRVPGGKVFVGGYWETVDGIARPAIVRLNDDGTVDQSFDAEAVNDAVTEIAIDPEGNLYVGGYFTTIAGSNITGLARFKPVVPLTVRISDVRKTAEGVVLSVETEAGFNYSLEKRSVVEGGVWLRGETVPGTGGEISFNPVGTGGEAGFFRVAVE